MENEYQRQVTVSGIVCPAGIWRRTVEGYLALAIWQPGKFGHHHLYSFEHSPLGEYPTRNSHYKSTSVSALKTHIRDKYKYAAQRL